MCSRSHTTEALQAAFEKYGQLEDVWIVRDKFTKESRGVAYIKFSKMSEATLAVEKLDGKSLDDDTKPIKVALLSLYFDYTFFFYKKKVYKKMRLKSTKS